MPDTVSRFRKLTGRRGGRPLRARRPSVPPRERALVALVLLNVVWLVFAMGGVKVWGEVTSLALTLSTLLLLPRWKHGELENVPSPALQIIRLPLFWAGLGLYTYFFIQSWNVAWTWSVVGGRPHFVPLEPAVDWLPTGVVAPFDESNPVRFMVFYTIPWISCCAVWAGLGTRRSVLWMLHGLAWIGIAFSLVALRQHFLHLDTILGLFPILPSRVGQQIPFWGTLHNANHAAYFLILITGICLGLFLYHWCRDMRNFRKAGGVWLLYLGFAFLCTFSVLMAQARGAIIFVLALWLLFILICTVFFIRRFGTAGLALPGVFLLVFLFIAATFVINPDVFESQKREWTKTFTLVENPELEARYFMMQITSDMIHDRPWYGHGAGSWRYLHLPYLGDYPEFRTTLVRWKKNEFSGKPERRNITIWFQNAHVDLLEYVVEWGIIGCMFPFMGFWWLLYRGILAARGWDPGIATFMAAVILVLAGGLVEFHFRIPLVILVWSLLLVLTIKLAELNTPAP